MMRTFTCLIHTQGTTLFILYVISPVKDFIYLISIFAVKKFLSCIMLIGNVMCAVTTAEVTKSFFQFYSLFLFS